MLLRVRGHHFSESIKDSDTEEIGIRLTIFSLLLLAGFYNYYYADFLLLRHPLHSHSFVVFTMFLTLFGVKLNGTDSEDVVRSAFSLFDTNNTGFISEDCLREAMTTMGDRFTNEEVFIEICLFFLSAFILRFV